MGIREGTFTVRVGDVGVDAGGAAPDVGTSGRVGADGAEVGDVAVVGGSDGPDAVGGPDVAWWGWAAESSRRCVLGGLEDNLRKAATAAASCGLEGVPWACGLGRATSDGVCWAVDRPLSSESEAAVATGVVASRTLLSGTSWCCCCAGCCCCCAAASGNRRSPHGCHTPPGP